MRIALIGCIAVALAFAAGVGLRLSGDTSDAVPERARPVDSGTTPRQVRLLRVDPGILPRPAEPATGAAAGPVESSAAVGPAAPPAPTAPAPQPSTPPEGSEGFDSPGQEAPSEANTFDSEG